MTLGYIWTTGVRASECYSCLPRRNCWFSDADAVVDVIVAAVLIVLACREAADGCASAKNFLTCVLMICLKYSMQLAFPHITVAVKNLISLIICRLETQGLHVNVIILSIDNTNLQADDIPPRYSPNA